MWYCISIKKTICADMCYINYIWKCCMYIFIDYIFIVLTHIKHYIYWILWLIFCCFSFLFIFQSIEFFLSKDITHFITDKKQTTSESIGIASNEQVKRQIICSNHSASSTSLRNPQTPKSLVDIPSVPSPIHSYDTKVLNLYSDKKLHEFFQTIIKSETYCFTKLLYFYL